jgi:hypothetical protein
MAPAAPSKANAWTILIACVAMLLVGAHFTDPVQMRSITSAALRLAAAGLHLGGGIVVILGIYRVWKATRAR